MLFEKIGSPITPSLILTGIIYDKILEEFLNKKTTKEILIPKNPFLSTTFNINLGKSKIRGKKEKETTEDVYLTKINTPEDNTLSSILNNNFWIREEQIKENRVTRCRHCGRMKDHMIGIPYSIEAIYYSDLLIIKTEQYACNLSCALSYCIKQDDITVVSKYSLTPCRTRIVKWVQEYLYPGVELKKALDPDLLICNGGTMTDEEYDKNAGVYFKTVNFEKNPQLNDISFIYEKE